VRRRRPRPRLAELRARLAKLRETATWLALHAGLGRDLRRFLAEEGSPTWTPSEDLSWRRWIERHGDDEARQLLAAIDAELEARAAEISSRAAEEASEACTSPATDRPNRTRRPR
jgi:hypothetical protein